MLFFSGEVSVLAQSYAGLFQKEDDEDEEKGEESGSGGEDGGDNKDDGFVKRYWRSWGWISQVDRVAELRRLTWEQVFAMNVVEFLNMLCYMKDKSEMDKIQMREWKRINHIK